MIRLIAEFTACRPPNRENGRGGAPRAARPEVEAIRQPGFDASTREYEHRHGKDALPRVVIARGRAELAVYLSIARVASHPRHSRHSISTPLETIR